MKKFMKGLLATTMVFAMMTSLAGCGGDAATDDSADAKKQHSLRMNITKVRILSVSMRKSVRHWQISWAWISKSRIWNLILSFLR